MTADKAPRRFKFINGVGNWSWEEAVLASDYDALATERDELLDNESKMNGALSAKQEIIDSLKAELSREKKKVEKLREQRNRAYEAIYSGEAGEWACDPSVWIDFDENQLEAIDKESEGAR